METLNMMTKYQLVFLRLETGMIKLIRSYMARQRPLLRRAFLSWKGRFLPDPALRSVTVQQAFRRFERLLTRRVPRSLARNRKAVLLSSWRRWGALRSAAQQQARLAAEMREVAASEAENEKRRSELETRRSKRHELAN